MKLQLLAKFVMVAMIAASFTSPARSFGQSSERDDSLKPYTSCKLDSGLRIVQVDRLPKDVKSRTVKTSKDDQNISLADGYRVMVAYNDDRDWFANVKAEKSFSTEYQRDKQGVIENLKWAASTSNELESQEPEKVSFNGHEGYGTSKRTLTGDMLGIYVFFSDVHHTITTIYFINQNAKRKKFQTIEEWRTLRDEFLNTYSSCINSSRDAKLNPALETSDGWAGMVLDVSGPQDAVRLFGVPVKDKDKVALELPRPLSWLSAWHEEKVFRTLTYKKLRDSKQVRFSFLEGKLVAITMEAPDATYEENWIDPDNLAQLFGVVFKPHNRSRSKLISPEEFQRSAPAELKKDEYGYWYDMIAVSEKSFIVAEADNYKHISGLFESPDAKRRKRINERGTRYPGYVSEIEIISRTLALK